MPPTPPPRPPCKRCGRPTPFQGRKWCTVCLDAYRQRAESPPGWLPPPKPRSYTIDELPACPHCGALAWELHREHEGYEAWCPCGFIAYSTPALPLVRERLGEHGEGRRRRGA